MKGIKEKEGEDDIKAKQFIEVRFPWIEALYLKGVSLNKYIIKHGFSFIGVFVRYKEYKSRTSIIG